MAAIVMNSFSELPGPAPLPLVGWRGNVMQFAADPLDYLMRLKTEYGDLAAFVRGGNPPVFFGSTLPAQGTLFAFHPEAVRELFANADIYHSGPIIGELYPRGHVPERRRVLTWMGSGLFGVNGAEHRRQRALVMPAFHKQRIMAYHAEMVAQTDALMHRWRNGETRDVWRDMMYLTLQIAGKSLLGVNLQQDARDLGNLIQDWLKQAISPAVIFFPYDVPGAPYRRYLDNSWALDRMIRAIVRERMKSGAETNDVLSLLIHARDENGAQAFTEDEIVGHAAVFFAAGHETSSNALAWTLFLLSQHPRVMQDLNAELDAVLHGQPPTVEQLKELKLLDVVIKESMRLLPPVPMSGRIVTERVSFGGRILEPGTEIGFSSYVVHHDARVYENPNRFDPYRWERIKPTAYEYIPFSAGIRMCIGMPFALMEIPILLAMILQKYRLAMPHNAEVNPFVGITMSPQHGLKMQVHAQDGQFEASAGRVRGKIREMVELP